MHKMTRADTADKCSERMIKWEVEEREGGKAEEDWPVAVPCLSEAKQVERVDWGCADAEFEGELEIIIVSKPCLEEAKGMWIDIGTVVEDKGSVGANAMAEGDEGVESDTPN